MDIKIVELATQLTNKAMGADASAANWIGSEDKVSAFFKAIANTLETTYYQERPPSHR
jgi:hypothetical protein